MDVVGVLQLAGHADAAGCHDRGAVHLGQGVEEELYLPHRVDGRGQRHAVAVEFRLHR